MNDLPDNCLETASPSPPTAPGCSVDPIGIRAGIQINGDVLNASARATARTGDADPASTTGSAGTVAPGLWLCATTTARRDEKERAGRCRGEQHSFEIHRAAFS